MPAAVVLLALLLGAQPLEHVVTIQVHGNVLTPEADILAIAAVKVGDRFDAASADQITRRLREAHRFDTVDVLKRYASISDPSQIALVIVVHEAVTVNWNGKPDEAPVKKRRGPPLMYAPMLSYEDGYGFTYGLKTAWPEPFGNGSRIAVPLTWGGDKRAGLELEQPVSATTRVLATLAANRRENPYFEADDDRQSARVRVERDVGRPVRVGGTIRTDSVSFLEIDTRMTGVGADLVVDTRSDPMMARNAVYGRAAWDRLTFSDTGPVQRIDLEARGYLGLPSGATLIGRVRRQDSNQPLPSFERPLFGGVSTVRGFAVGSAIGDTIFAASAEARVPLTSALKVGHFGLSAFIDTGTVYDKGQRLSDQVFQQGFGGGAWIAATLFRLNAYVAHGVGGSTRVHVETTLLF